MNYLRLLRPTKTDPRPAVHCATCAAALERSMAAHPAGRGLRVPLHLVPKDRP